MRSFRILVLLIFSGSVGFAEEIDFVKDVQPILAGHCFECHGTDEQAREGGLRLDRREDALAGGDSYGRRLYRTNRTKVR